MGVPSVTLWLDSLVNVQTQYDTRVIGALIIGYVFLRKTRQGTSSALHFMRPSPLFDLLKRALGKHRVEALLEGMHAGSPSLPCGLSAGRLSVDNPRTRGQLYERDDVGCLAGG